MVKKSKSVHDPLRIDRAPKRRPARVAAAIKHELALLLLRGVKDPRLRQLAISEVKVTDDLKRALVFYLTPEEHAREAAEGLRRARGFLRSHLAQELNLRYAPELVFERDRSLDWQERMEALLREIKEADDFSAE